MKDHKFASATSKGDNGAGATDGDEVGATPDTFLLLIIETLNRANYPADTLSTVSLIKQAGITCEKYYVLPRADRRPRRPSASFLYFPGAKHGFGGKQIPRRFLDLETVTDGRH